MPGAELGLPSGELVRGVEVRPHEMPHAGLGGDLEVADAPVDFRFFANGEAVRIYECKVDVLEDGVQSRFVVGVAFDDADVG